MLFHLNLRIRKEEDLDGIDEIDINRAFTECDIDTVVKYVKDPSIPEANKYSANLFVAAAQKSTDKDDGCAYSGWL